MSQSFELDPSLRPYEPGRSEIIFSPEWFKRPPLVMSRKAQVVGEVGREVIAQLLDLTESLYQRISEEFSRHGCSSWYWDEGRIQQPSPHMVVLQPVFLGKINRAVETALFDPNFESFKAGLREHLPEHDPLAIEIGKRKMNLNPPLHPNFINMIFVDDSSGKIMALDYERKLVLLRMLFAKHGSFKSIIVPYRKEVDSLIYDQVILSTLEGGHPNLEVEELAKRLLVFGSLTQVGGREPVSGLFIAREVWESSMEVNGLINLGRFLGERGLLSAPVEVEELVKDPQLARKIIKLLEYSRQAEGAFMAFAPDLPTISGLPWTGIPVVSASGRFGSIKTDLGYDDLVAVVPLRGWTQKKLKVGTLVVDGLKIKGPSVEAEEFTHPLVSLAYEDPSRFLLRLSRVDGGYLENHAGEVAVPAFRGVIHMHRGFVLPSSNRVAFIDIDFSKFPPAGCGVDRMFAMSQDAMRRAFDVWMQGGRRAVAIVFPVPDHGTNIFVPWTAEAGRIIPEETFALFKEVVENGELKFTPEVPQI